MAIAPIRIPTINRDPIVDNDRRPTTSFQRTLNDSLKSIEFALNQLISIPQIQALLANLDTATAAAQTAADNASMVAASTTAQSNLANSYVTGLTLTATDTGTDVTVTISDHFRVYGDGSSVAVTGGSVTGLAYDTLYYITYEDPARAGGTVSYMVTTNVDDAAQLGDTHVVGSTQTPMAGSPPATGKPVRPPGAGTLEQYQ